MIWLTERVLFGVLALFVISAILIWIVIILLRELNDLL